MAAHQNGVNRLQVAERDAERLVGRLGPNQVGSVIAMGAEPRLVLAESGDRGALVGAIKRLRPELVAPNAFAALSLAASLARPGVPTQAVLLTTRQSGIDGSPVALPFPLRIVRLGGQVRDLGIVAFRAAEQSGHTAAIVRVANFGARRAAANLDLDIDGILADVRILSVAPGSQRTLSWDNLPSGAHLLRAHLTLRDDMTPDKTAWAVVPPAGVSRVLLVSHGDYFLQTALALQPAVHLTTISPAAYRSPGAGQFDLVIFDGYLPPFLPRADTLFVDPPRGGAGPLRFGAFRPGGTMSGVRGTGPSWLLGPAGVGDGHVARARAVTLPSGLHPVITAARTTLLAAGTWKGRRMAVVTFNLQESDWPLQLSYPLVMGNLLTYLAPGLPIGTVNAASGQAIPLHPAAGVRQVQIARPDGRIDILNRPFPDFRDTSLPGVYTLRETGPVRETLRFAVNFFRPLQRDMTGPSVLNYGRLQGTKVRQEPLMAGFGPPFAVLALAFLLTEWWFAYRG